MIATLHVDDSRAVVQRQNRKTVIEVPSTTATVQNIPSHDGAALCSVFVKATDLPEILEDWMRVNPRRPKQSKLGRLSGQQSRVIMNTLKHAPEDFCFKNLGIYLLAEDVQESRGKLHIVLSDRTRHGIANGGHTFASIRQCLEDAKRAEDLLSGKLEGVELDSSEADRIIEAAPEHIDRAYVRLHIYKGVPKGKVTEFAEGMNRSLQVDDTSLMNLAGLFRDIQRAIKGHRGASQVYYSQGGRGAYSVANLLLWMELFNAERYSGTAHPSGLYRQKSRMLATFREDAEMSPSPIRLLCTRLPEILEFRDQVMQAIPGAAKEHVGFEIGRMKVGRTRLGSSKNRKVALHFLGDFMDYKIPDGWLLPILAAYRANVKWDLGRNKFEWKQPLEKVLHATIGDVVRVLVTEHSQGTQPQEMGRKTNIYEQCYDKVKMHLGS